MNEEMQDLAMDDLATATERLYIASLRLCRAFERDEINGEPGASGVSVGVAAALLTEATARHADAYGRCENSGFFDSHDQALPGA